MKKLLLAALVLTAGMINTEHVAASAATQQIELKKAPQPPAAVLAAFAADVAQFESNGDVEVRNITWSSSKGKFKATYEFYYPANGEVYSGLSSTYNRKGDQI